MFSWKVYGSSEGVDRRCRRASVQSGDPCGVQDLLCLLCARTEEHWQMSGEALTLHLGSRQRTEVWPVCLGVCHRLSTDVFILLETFETSSLPLK